MSGGLPYRPCAGIVLAREDGHVFAGQRIDSAANAWQMPQGGIDPGESPQQAALRELSEETGIAPGLVRVEAETDEWIHYDLPEELLGRLWGGRYGGQMQKWFLLRFEGTDADIRIDTAHPEFSEWAWMRPEELVERIVPFKRDVYDAVFGAFRDML